jgi:exosome complex component RRP4
MAITILAPAPPPIPYQEDSSSDDSDHGGVDLEGDAQMPPAKRARHAAKNMVTPGETVTDDPQWMRYSALIPLLCHQSNKNPEVMVPT